jgi:hypothetical protein
MPSSLPDRQDQRRHRGAVEGAAWLAEIWVVTDITSGQGRGTAVATAAR